MHSVALVVEAEETAGDWGAIRGLRPRIEEAVAANADTPCVRNARTLLLCAVASEIAGEGGAAEELERAAAEVGFATHDWALVPPRIRLALVRGDLDALPPLLAAQTRHSLTFGVPQLAARLDALAMLRKLEPVEAEAPGLVQARTYLEPFALRALGIVREDAELLAQADERFAALGLDWHRAQTDALLAGA
jgi:hypothetical protein